MAAAAVISPLTHAFSFLKEHPKLSCVLLLLLSPPINRILLYFIPLLLSTALCIFALITLAPYVTATEAEVEKQSMLGASCQQLKKQTFTSTTSSTRKERSEDVSGYGKPPPSSAASSSSSAGDSSYAPSVAPAPCSSSVSESSWFSWMKGLNDIGRAWMESKLVEQGLSLSEPANRKTLLAFIQGSFADLLGAEESPNADIFAGMDPCVEAGSGSDLAYAVEKNDEEIKASNLECVNEGCALQKSMKEEEVVHAKVTVNGDDGNEERRAAMAMSSAISVGSKEHSHAAHEVESMKGSSGALFDDVKVLNQKHHVAHEGSLLRRDGICEMSSAANIMPRTPSRNPAPSKLIEASKKIFSKEEQSKTMLPRAPLQYSVAGRVNQTFRSSLGSTPSKMANSASGFKLPTRKFLERSWSTPTKELGTKLSSSTMMETLAGCKVVQSEAGIDVTVVGEVNDVCGANEGVGEAGDGVCNTGAGVNDMPVGNTCCLPSGSGDDGPRFDEDLKAEEAQALVQSELKMLEVELDEVAAKLPKLDEAFAYQKTPIKSVAASNLPIGASAKCGTTLFSVSSSFKTS